MALNRGWPWVGSLAFTGCITVVENAPPGGGSPRGDRLDLPQGTLELHRLERRGWISASWGTSEHNRRAKYYALTPEGTRQLESDVEAWRALTAAVGRVLDAG